MRRGLGKVKMVVITTHTPGEVGTVAVRGATVGPARPLVAGQCSPCRPGTDPLEREPRARPAGRRQRRGRPVGRGPGRGGGAGAAHRGPVQGGPLRLGHPVGPGRGGGGAAPQRGRRAAPGDSEALHAADTLRPGPACATPPPWRCWSARGRPGCASWPPSAPCSTATTGACGSSAREGGHSDGPGRSRRRGGHRRRSRANPRRRGPADGRPHLGGLVRPGPDRRRRAVPGCDRARPEGPDRRAAGRPHPPGDRAAPASSTPSRPTRPSRPATAWPWRCGPGVPVADVEFVQFHPTALHGSAAGPRPLLSEALRGEGALLRDHRGRRFVDELQPRDVVAAAVAARIREDGVDHVWLDVSGRGRASQTRFPDAGGGRARTSASTPAATGCPWRRPPTTCAAAS